MPAPHRAAAGRSLALSIMLVVVAACGDKPSPAPSDAAAVPPSGGPAASVPAGGPGASGAPVAVGEDATSGDLIAAAYAAGTIDRPTALLYSLQATVGDERLPDEYRGAPAEDDGALTIVATEWDTFTDTQREAFLPYVVRPTDPKSIYALPGTATTRRPAAGVVTLASAHAAITAADCVDGFVRQPVPGLPAVVWGQCGGLSESGVLGLVDEISADVADAWERIANLMGGDPIGDRNIENDGFPDAPEGDDGMLDIYVVAGSVGGHARAISTNAVATTYPAAPLAGPANAETSSAYMVVDWTAGAGVKLQSTIVHELFHAFQYAHNNAGLTLESSDGTSWSRYWFMEASATWAEHEFVPAARASEVYPRISTFQEASVGLASTAGSNEYASWLWPLFMRQEEGPEAIGDAWFDLEGVSGFANLQQAVGRSIAFEDRFGDFAVRAYDDKLEPGDPIDPAFWDVDPSFPVEVPVDPRAEYGVDVPPDGKLERAVSMPPLWSHATELITDGIPTVTFDFDELTSGTNVSVDLLVKTKKDGWQRRPGTIGKVCDAERVIVILGNGNATVGADQKGTWSATGSDDPCNDGNWTVTLIGGKAGAGTYSGRADGVSCYEKPDGTWQFSVDMDPTTGDIRHITASSDGIAINTRFAMDDPIDWGAIRLRGAQITTSGDKSQEPWTAHAEATWHDVPTNSTLSSRVDVVCSEWFTLTP